MEHKIIAMLVVMFMGSLLVETEAIEFQECYKFCTLACGATAEGFKKLTSSMAMERKHAAPQKFVVEPPLICCLRSSIEAISITAADPCRRFC
ncbi:unnamed protein product [Eruca vesicaria subsp. sativa]|uniref:Uncharacterized protein n=1 Tax=Eruca vesicaria subsp. sativa TaxID=29727 RepID=A0ABC8JE55_ERUVS|nr:unnamed protein product [Eruca vesicaria subsp. sativa]